MIFTTADFIWSVLTINFSITLIWGRDTLVSRSTLVFLGITAISNTPGGCYKIQNNASLLFYSLSYTPLLIQHVNSKGLRQFCSSESSPQSLSPSHRQIFMAHLPLAHLNSFGSHNLSTAIKIQNNHEMENITNIPALLIRHLLL